MGLFSRAPKPLPTCTPADIPGRPASVRLEGAAKEALDTGRTRLVVSASMFALVFLALSARLVDLTLFRSGGETVSTRPSDLTVPGFIPERRSITDRDGIMLATNLRMASLYADPRRVMQPEEAAARLAQVLPELSEADTLAKLTSGKSFVWLKRNLTPKQQFEVNRLGIPGLAFLSEQRRVWPQGALTTHVVGYTDIDGKGISGIEAYFDDALRDPSQADQPLRLSVDIRVQHVLRDEVKQSISFFNAIGGGAIVLDVHTGELIAMVSMPDFEPTQPGEASKEARFNRITLGVYEMGSTMKTLNTAMALDANTVKISGGYDATNPIQISRFTIRDDHPKRRWLSVPEIYMYSSNIGSARMAVDVGPNGQRAFMERLGMLRKPVVELPEVGAPLVPRNWKIVETMTIAFGHGLSVSPLQLASATAAIVNGGVLHPATLVKRPPGLPAPGVQVIRPDVSDQMRRLMHLVVEDGTGKKADVEGYLVGGKTGTSEKIGVHGGYNRKALLTTFVAVFPMHKPRYVVLGMLDEPKGNKSTHGFATAGWTSAPMVGRMITRIAPILGVPPADAAAADIRQALFIDTAGKMERKVVAN